MGQRLKKKQRKRKKNFGTFKRESERKEVTARATKEGREEAIYMQGLMKINFQPLYKFFFSIKSLFLNIKFPNLNLIP